jgi:hypothetical protein
MELQLKFLPEFESAISCTNELIFTAQDQCGTGTLACAESLTARPDELQTAPIQALQP